MIGGFYEALLALKVILDGHEIPDFGWGHNPTASGLDMVSINKNGTVFIWDSKGTRGTSKPTQFDRDSKRQALMKEAEGLISRASNLTEAVKIKAIDNLSRQRVQYRTAYGHAGAGGWKIVRGYNK
ncbi:hypothetical protein [Paludisphaera soli]|uniref:hypothetical protein n=1 Tax=Paludisphaera soli TaxID=2712865 RepID=UPI0013ECB82B|nr:hypothetical protein [Paludisphaera soli]